MYTEQNIPKGDEPNLVEQYSKKSNCLKHASELIIKARDDNKNIEIVRPSDILTIIANALYQAAEETKQ